MQIISGYTYLNGPPSVRRASSGDQGIEPIRSSAEAQGLRKRRFAALVYGRRNMNRQTCREPFPAAMDAVTPRHAPTAEPCAVYPRNVPPSRPPPWVTVAGADVPGATMVWTYGRGIQAVVGAGQSIRWFMGIGLPRGSAPGEASVLELRRLLSAHEHMREASKALTGQPAGKLLLLREKTIGDGRPTGAPPLRGASVRTLSGPGGAGGNVPAAHAREPRRAVRAESRPGSDLVPGHEGPGRRVSGAVHGHQPGDGGAASGVESFGGADGSCRGGTVARGEAYVSAASRRDERRPVACRGAISLPVAREPQARRAMSNAAIRTASAGPDASIRHRSTPARGLRDLTTSP